MNKFFTLILLSVSLAACNQEQHTHENESSAKLDASKIQLASETDPVCKMSVKKEMADTAMYEGKIYGFCSKNCKKEFLKDPGAHVK